MAGDGASFSFGAKRAGAVRWMRESGREQVGRCFFGRFAAGRREGRWKMHLGEGTPGG